MFDLISLITDKHVFVSNQVKKYGLVSRASLLGNEAIIVAGRDLLHQILLKDKDLFTQGYFKTLAKLLGPHSMLSMDGEEHVMLRKLMGPAFTKRAVYSYTPEIARLAQEHCSEWARKGSIIFLEEMRRYAFSVTAEAALGIDFPVGTRSKEAVMDDFRACLCGILSLGIELPFTKFGKAMEARRRLVEAIDEMILAGLTTQAECGLTHGVFHVMDCFPCLTHPPKWNATTDRCMAHEVKSVSKYSVSVLHQAMETLKEDPNSRGGLRAMIYARDDEGHSLTREQLEDSTLSLLFAGYDTTASTGSTAMLQLAQHSEMWEEIRKEQNRIVARYGPELTETAIEAMVYTEAVVREAARILPPADGTFKVATQTFQLDGYRIPKGATVFPATGATAKHFDDRWPLDEEFRPERHLSGAGLDSSPDLVFGLGAHSCVGRVLAVVENKVLLATLARGYDFAVLDTDPRIVNSPFPQPEDGLPMVVRRRGET